MKKMLTSAVVMAALSTPAFATTNLENPLYMPTAGEAYAKVGAGLMYVETDDNMARKAKNHVNATEFPIYRASGDVGVGLTDFLTLRGSFGYTHNGDIDRQGLHNGRVGLNFRASEFLPTDGWVWDVYMDAQLGGLSRMNADLIAANPEYRPLSFNYDNYSNGRWGVYAGTQLGKTWGKFTGAAFVEVLRTFGNDNNKITLAPSGAQRIDQMVTMNVAETFPDPHPFNAAAGVIGDAFMAGLPDSFNVETKSTWEYSAGLKSLYEIDSKWSIGAGFTYKHRAANTIKSVKADVDIAQIVDELPVPVKMGLEGAGTTPEAFAQALVDGVMGEFLGSMYDSVDEYIMSLAVAYQVNETMQVAVYGEYTFDDAGHLSQNGTDIKAEFGARLNVRF